MLNVPDGTISEVIRKRIQRNHQLMTIARLESKLNNLILEYDKFKIEENNKIKAKMILLLNEMNKINEQQFVNFSEENEQKIARLGIEYNSFTLPHNPQMEEDINQAKYELSGMLTMLEKNKIPEQVEGDFYTVKVSPTPHQ